MSLRLPVFCLNHQRKFGASRVFNCGTEQILKSSPELITLDTGEVMDPAIVDSLRTDLTTGQNMFTEFVTERIENASKS